VAVEAIRARLLRLDVCAVSDALDACGLPPGCGAILPRTGAEKLAGRAVTVRLAAGPAPAGSPPRHLCTAAIERAAPGDIVVIEQRTGIEAGSWGGLLSASAIARGIAGAVADGPVRDVDESRARGFAVWSRGITPRTARGRVHEAETGGAVTIGDARVETGDWIIADGSGVAAIPAAHLEAVLEAAEAVAAKEAAMAAAVGGGGAATQVMGAAYERMLEHGR
jgi:regulator of RNase E activity RraA